MRYNVGDLISTVSCYDRTPFAYFIKSLVQVNEIPGEDPSIKLCKYEVYVLDGSDKPLVGYATEHIGKVTVINCRTLQCESSWQEEHILKYHSKTNSQTDELWKKLNKGIYRS